MKTILIILVSLATLTFTAFTEESSKLTNGQRLRIIMEYEAEAKKGDLDKYKLAIKESELLAKDNPGYPLYTGMIGTTYADYYLALKKRGIDKPEYLQKAEVLVDQAARKDPHQAVNYHRIGYAYLEDGKIKKVQSINKKLKTCLPDDDYLDEFLEMERTDRKNKEDIERQKQKNKKRKEEEKQYRNEIKKRRAADKVRWERQIKENPEAIKPHFELAYYFRMIDEWDKAQKEYEAILRIDPNNSRALKSLKRIKVLIDKLEKLKESLR